MRFVRVERGARLELLPWKIRRSRRVSTRPTAARSFRSASRQSAGAASWSMRRLGGHAWPCLSHYRCLQSVPQSVCESLQRIAARWSVATGSPPVGGGGAFPPASWCLWSRSGLSFLGRTACSPHLLPRELCAPSRQVPRVASRNVSTDVGLMVLLLGRRRKRKFSRTVRPNEMTPRRHVTFARGTRLLGFSAALPALRCKKLPPDPAFANVKKT